MDRLALRSMSAGRLMRVAVARSSLGIALAVSPWIAHSQEAAQPVASAVGASQPTLPAGADAGDAQAGYRRYSSNRKTNDRLNAVFALIRTEGNGLTWEKAQPEDEAEDPVRVAAKPVSGKGAKDATTATTSKDAAKPAAPEPPKPEPLPVLTWTFKPNATARETLSTWAKAAGWNEPKWNATNPFQGQGEVRGTFIDALQAMASAAPQLDFRAEIDKREIIVTDASSP